MTQSGGAVSLSEMNYGLHYRKWHNSSPSHVSEQVNRLGILFGDALPPASSEPVIDIGCGMGFAMQMLSRRGFSNVVGVDIDAGQVEECRAQGLDAELIDDTEQYLADKQERFLLAMMIDVLEHLPWERQLPTLIAVRKSLLPGGRLLLAVPNATSTVAMRWRHIDYTHFNSFTEYSVEFLLRNAGFDRVEIGASDPAMSLREALNPFVCGRFLCSREGRRRLKLAIVRWAWMQVLDAEIPCDSSKIPLGRNLHVVAYKD